MNSQDHMLITAVIKDASTFIFIADAILDSLRFARVVYGHKCTRLTEIAFNSNLFNNP